MDILVNLVTGTNYGRYAALFELKTIYSEWASEEDIEKKVRNILHSVWTQQISAVISYTEQFDGVKLTQNEIEIPASELDKAFESLDERDRSALERAAANIREFHSRHLPETWADEIRSGALLGQRVTPIERVGVYVPGGRAFYPSSVLMNVVPAVVAGCDQIIMVSPPSFNGTIHPGVLAAAKIAGVSRVFRIGGVQAVAALAYGIDPVPKVDKIVGPGNAYVTCAKRLLTSYVDIDKEAGPSEVIVVADSTANPQAVAADLIAQAEHDPDAVSILLTPDESLAAKVHGAMIEQLDGFSRQEAEVALERNGAIIVTKSMDHAIELVNQRAPEHLALIVEQPDVLLDSVKNAGAVFLGQWSPVTVGDYYAGPNHVLPTGRKARSSSPLRTEDFLKVMSTIEYTRERLELERADIVRLAKLEGLIGHARAVDTRVERVAAPTSTPQKSMSYARPSVARAKGYVPGEQPTDSDYIKLNTNESPYPPSPKVVEAVRRAVDASLRMYPEPTARSLREKVGQVYGFDPREIIIGNGMDDLLSIAVRSFVEPAESVITTYPTYTLYTTLAELHGASVVTHELTETFDLPETIFSSTGKLALISNPNSPTGKLHPLDDITRLCAAFPGVVVIDEAYVDFADTNAIELARNYKNVLVMRTLSKSFSLAGMRIGFAVGHESLIAEMMKVKDSYNVNRLSQVAAWYALDDIDVMRTNIEKIVATRSRTAAALADLGFDVVPSASNFLLVTHPAVPAKTIFDELASRHILVRYFDAPRLSDSLRISIGSDTEMNTLIHNIKQILQETAP